MKHVSLALVLLCTLTGPLYADVKPANLFSDHVVLQREIALPVWGTDAPGQKITVSFAGQEKSAEADANGKWKVKLDPLSASNDGREMTIAGSSTVKLTDVLVGDVWLLSGQSNMLFTLPAATTGTVDMKTATDPAIRFRSITAGAADEPQADVPAGQWLVGSPENAKQYSAVGYYFARKVRDELNVPIGLIQTASDGVRIQSFIPRATMESLPDGKADVDKYLKQSAEWSPAVAATQSAALTAQYEKALKAYEALPLNQQKPENRPMKAHEPAEPRTNLQHPYAIFNGRIAPLTSYAIRGAIWYQGEANGFGNGGYLYRAQLSGLIKSWRAAWGQGDFPFLVVQLPSFDYGPLSEQYHITRESQFVATHENPNTALVVTADLGESNNLHPRNKKPVGERLALAAMHLAYGKDVAYAGPTFDKTTFNDGKATLSFTNIGGGLVGRGPKLTGFEIAGDDQKFVEADARIVGDTVVAWSDDVPTPVAVRYAFAPAPAVSLSNKVGLPAVPFRTDDWAVVGALGYKKPAAPVVTTLPTPVAAPPGPPAGKHWEPITEFTDEFNGEKLDETKWYDHDPKWIGRPPGLFMPSNVAVKDGLLQLTAKVEDVLPPANPNPKLFNTFTTAFVKSKALANYGYYEIRAKPMNANIVSAFWFYAVEPDWHTEIDVFEIPGGNEKEGTVARMTYHIFKTPTWKGTDLDHIKSGTQWPASYRFADDFHVFGLEWNEKEIKWSIDGVVRRTAKNNYNSRPMNLCFDNETFPSWFGLPTKDSLPAVYQIDYVRAWRESPAAQPTAESR